MFIAGLIIGIMIGLGLFLIIDIGLTILDYLVEHHEHIPEFLKKVGKKLI